VAEILGKVTASMVHPRGADVSLRITVPRLWLHEGRTIEVELPRNLVCANCSGGGCNACGNSGAITLRGRGELPEFIQVSLPEQGRVEPSSPSNDSLFRDISREPPSSKNHGASRNVSVGLSPEGTVPTGADIGPISVRPVTIRIPECGGLPDSGSVGTVRGWLLLNVAIAEEPSVNVKLLDDNDPLSSSRMLRAEVRSIPRQDRPGAVAPKESRSHPGAGTVKADESGRKLSRPAKTVSVRVRGTERVARKSRDGSSAREERSLIASGTGARKAPSFLRTKRAIGLGVSIWLVAVIAMILWYFR